MPLDPELITRVFPSMPPPLLAISMGAGMASWVWPPRMASTPCRRAAIFMSTSMPLWDRITTTSALSPSRISSTSFWAWLSSMPKDHPGIL